MKVIFKILKKFWFVIEKDFKKLRVNRSLYYIKIFFTKEKKLQFYKKNSIIICLIAFIFIGLNLLLNNQNRFPYVTEAIFKPLSNIPIVKSLSDSFFAVFWKRNFEMANLKQELELSKIKEQAANKLAQEEAVKRDEAEERSQQEAIRRSQAEARAKQEEFERKLKEQQLSEKEAEEQKMNADNDGDGLTYRSEEQLGTFDWNVDSDADGIRDGEDAHPAGGGRYIAQNFQWDYEGTPWTWNFSIQEDWYEYYKNKPRSPQGTVYVTQNDPFIKQIAQELKDTANNKGYHLSSFIVSFVQGLSYVEDYYTTFDEYPKYPIETFIERNGDCEDTSYLFSSLVSATGLGVSLVEFHDHMGVGIKTVHNQSGYYYPVGDEWYYYYETTGEGWEIGQLPDDYLFEKAIVIRVWDGSIYNLYPQNVKPCYYSPDFPGYYYDGSNYYADSQCQNYVYCMLYKDGDYYVKPNELNFYWDRNCSQLVVKGCNKSTDYLGYFYDIYGFYNDSRCINEVNICRPSSIYSDRYWDGNDNYWDSSCAQKVLYWCTKSSSKPGYFVSSLDFDYYYDYQCTQKSED